MTVLLKINYHLVLLISSVQVLNNDWSIVPTIIVLYMTVVHIKMLVSFVKVTAIISMSYFALMLLL